MPAPQLHTSITDVQRRLLAELAPWQILSLADAPEYWCSYFRNSAGGGGTVRGDWPPQRSRKHYGWGFAVTTYGDHCSERKVTDTAHAATITWKQLVRWAEALPADMRAEARRARQEIQRSVSRASTADEVKTAVDDALRAVPEEVAARIIAHGAVIDLDAELELTLW